MNGYGEDHIDMFIGLGEPVVWFELVRFFIPIQVTDRQDSVSRDQINDTDEFEKTNG